jgi:hypothetical protein
MIGSLKTVPFKMFLIVPLGLLHIFFKPNSLTRASSGVIVAHLIATLYLHTRKEKKKTLRQTIYSETNSHEQALFTEQPQH